MVKGVMETLVLSLATLGALWATMLVVRGARTKDPVVIPPPRTDHSLRMRLQAVCKGQVTDSVDDRTRMSRDTSLFERMPLVVAYPHDAADVAALIREVSVMRREGVDVSLTARAAGTDMSGGPLTYSVVVSFRDMHRIHEVGDGYAVAEPGVFYRDFEKATLAQGKQLMPSFPASRELAALGGIVNNDSGGERTLEYGKTRKYVEELEVVLADGSHAVFGPLTAPELLAKKQLATFEGSVYRLMDDLVSKHAEVIDAHKPTVSKNSAGYALWEVRDRITGVFNLAKLITGAQGTLAFVTKMKLRLVKDQPYRSMLVVFLDDLAPLPDIVSDVLAFNPESFESFDRHTLSLALRFLPRLMVQMGVRKAMALGWSFLPELRMLLTGGLPTLILMAEFSEDSREAAVAAAKHAQQALTRFGLATEVLADERASAKYWTVRRESFALLRRQSQGLVAAPFIDDFVVPPSCYPQFLPELDQLLGRYKGRFIYTIAGHIGNGNFHIIPLMDLTDPSVRSIVTELSPLVYSLVLKYGGSTTGEHNDGIIRTPYLPQMFGESMVALFAETKRIFDPQNILNPGKKVGGTFKDIETSMRTGV
jgi:FAD/FMN-containing dehydrogenase